MCQTCVNEWFDRQMFLFSDDKRAHDVLGASATIEILQYPSPNSLNNNQKVKSVWNTRMKNRRLIVARIRVYKQERIKINGCVALSSQFKLERRSDQR